MKEWLFPSQCARCGESEADTEWNVDQVKEESVYQTYSINVPVCEDCRSVLESGTFVSNGFACFVGLLLGGGSWLMSWVMGWLSDARWTGSLVSPGYGTRANSHERM